MLILAMQDGFPSYSSGYCRSWFSTFDWCKILLSCISDAVEGVYFIRFVVGNSNSASVSRTKSVHRRYIIPWSQHWQHNNFKDKKPKNEEVFLSTVCVCCGRSIARPCSDRELRFICQCSPLWLPMGSTQGTCAFISTNIRQGPDPIP